MEDSRPLTTKSFDIVPRFDPMLGYLDLLFIGLCLVDLHSELDVAGGCEDR